MESATPIRSLWVPLMVEAIALSPPVFYVSKKAEDEKYLKVHALQSEMFIYLHRETKMAKQKENKKDNCYKCNKMKYSVCIVRA